MTSLSDTQREKSPALTLVGLGDMGCRTVERLAIRKPDARCIFMDLYNSYLNIIEVPGPKIAFAQGFICTQSSFTDGQYAAEDSRDAIHAALCNCEAVILVADLGMDMSGGALPVVANIAKEAQVFCLCAGALPFRFKGKKSSALARETVQSLQDICDAVILMPNEGLREQAGPGDGLHELLALSEARMLEILACLHDTSTVSGVIDVDLPDLMAVFRAGGKIITMGMGEARGADCLQAALRAAQNDPLKRIDFGECVHDDAETVYLAHVRSHANVKMTALEAFGQALPSRYPIKWQLEPDWQDQAVVTLFTSA